MPGLNLAPSRVRPQQRAAGAALDDIVLDADEPLGGARTVEYQVKRRISPAPGNADFVEIIRRCLTEIGAEERDGPSVPVRSGRRRFGIFSRPSTALDDLERVTVVARSHDSAGGFLEVVRGTARAGVRERLDGLRETVAAVLAGDSGEVSPAPDDATVDNGTWRVARALFLWQLDAEPDGRDVLAAQDRLADLLRGRGDPAVVFRLLTDTVQEWAPQAGAINLGMLRKHLEGQGVALDETPVRRAAFETLVTRSAALLDPARPPQAATRASRSDDLLRADPYGRQRAGSMTADRPGRSSSLRGGRSTGPHLRVGRDRSQTESGGERAWPLIMIW